MQCTVGADRVSKYVKQSSDVWPFFWKLFGGLILIFTTSFDIWYFDKTISFGKHILYRQPYQYCFFLFITIRKSKIFLVRHHKKILKDIDVHDKIINVMNAVLLPDWNLPRVNFKYLVVSINVCWHCWPHGFMVGMTKMVYFGKKEHVWQTFIVLVCIGFVLVLAK